MAVEDSLAKAMEDTKLTDAPVEEQSQNGASGAAKKKKKNKKKKSASNAEQG